MSRNDESYISRSAGGSISFVGEDAVKLYQVTTLMHYIMLYKNAKIIPTRGMTITKMLASATSITQQKYKKGEYDKAISDLQKWIDAMKAAIPITY